MTHPSLKKGHIEGGFSNADVQGKLALEFLLFYNNPLLSVPH